MRSKRRSVDQRDLDGIRYRLELIVMERNIMSAIDDLNGKLAELDGVVSQVEAKVTALQAATGVPEAQVAAAEAHAQELLDRLAALATQ